MAVVFAWTCSDRRLAWEIVKAIDARRREAVRDGGLPQMVEAARTELVAFVTGPTEPNGTFARREAEPKVPQIRDSKTASAMLDVSTAASRLGVSESLVRRWCRSGELPARKEHGVWSIPSEAIDRRPRRRSTT